MNTDTPETTKTKKFSTYGKDEGFWVYCGTYHKYNCGSIAGAWMCLNDYADKDDFLSACHELHKDEADPELMYQDCEGFPKAFYSESGIDEKLFELLALDDDDREKVIAWIDHQGTEADFQSIINAYSGTFATLEDYVADYWEQCGDFKPSDQWWHPTNYIDWEKMAHDLENNGDITAVPCDEGIMIFNQV